SVTPFARWIEDYPLPDGLKMPSHVGSYDGKGDLDNFLHRFEGAIRMQKGLMPVACHMFTYTLKDSARIWWNSQKAVFTASNREKARVSELSPLGITSKGQGNPPRTTAWDRKLETGSPLTGDLITDCSPAYLKVQERFSPQKRNERAKTFDSQRGEKKEKSTIPAEASILMINQEEACTRNKISKIPTFEGMEITFPPVTKGSNSSALKAVHQKWVASPVMVKKSNEGWRMCVDFTDINKACPKDCYPLPDIDWKVESLSGFRLKKMSLLLSKDALRFKKRKSNVSKTSRQASTENLSAALFARRKEGQVPIYFISRVLQGAELNYPALEKLRLALVHIARRGNNNKETQEDFLIEAPLEDNMEKVGRRMDTKLEETKPRYEWKLYTDGVSSSDGSSTGLMLIDPEGKEYTYALCFEFKTTNNEAEYEALLAGLRIAQEIEIVKLAILVDFQLLVNQIKGIYASKQPAIREYLQRTKETLRSFKSYTIEHIRRNQNKKVDALSKLALMTFEHLTKEVLVKVLTRRSIEKKKVLQVETKEEKSWMTSIHEYFLSGLLPEDSKDSKKIRIKAP
nr:reverse transcriptase domain-containing protein [Tanacetum cinerariifolium]